MSLPIEYLEQQTCSSSCFYDVPAEMVDKTALIAANGANKDIRWHTSGVKNEFYQIDVPTELIKWED